MKFFLEAKKNKETNKETRKTEVKVEDEGIKKRAGEHLVETAADNDSYFNLPNFLTLSQAIIFLNRHAALKLRPYSHGERNHYTEGAWASR